MKTLLERPREAIKRSTNKTNIDVINMNPCVINPAIKAVNVNAGTKSQKDYSHMPTAMPHSQRPMTQMTRLFENLPTLPHAF